MIISFCSLTESNDFQVSGTNITIPPGIIPSSGRDCVTVKTTNDVILEEKERFDIVISGTDVHQVTIGTPDTTSIIIHDNSSSTFMCHGIMCCNTAA